MVRNAPHFQIDRHSPTTTVSYLLPLDTAPGTQVHNVDTSLQISTRPASNAPLDRLSSTHPVTEHTMTPGHVFRDGNATPPTHVPTGPEIYFGGMEPDDVTINGRAGIPQVAEPRNFCTAGGIARSLGWMIDAYGFEIDASLQDPETLLEQVSFGLGTTSLGTEFDGFETRVSLLQNP